MKRSIRCSLAVALVLILISLLTAAQQDPGYVPLKSIGSHRFPLPEPDLLKMRDAHDGDQMRKHAWELLAGLTAAKRANGKESPIWNTWYTKCDVGLMTCPEVHQKRTREDQAMRGVELPFQNFVGLLPLAPETDIRSFNPSTIDMTMIDKILDKMERRPLLATVVYNFAARQHIETNSLNSADGLKNILDDRMKFHSPEAEREVPPFPNDSVVLKMEWNVVLEEQGAHLTDALTLENRSPEPGGGTEPTDVVIDTDKKHCDDKDYVASQSGQPATVPLGCFYAFRVDPGSVMWDLLKEFVINPKTSAVTYLVLVAVHVTTKETADWVWATYWWNNRPSHSKYWLDPESKRMLRGNRWRHFLMDTTFSRTTPLEKDDGRKTCFNPFIESQLIDSNCIQCHRRAMYSVTQQTNKTTCGYSLGSAARCSETGAGPLQKCADKEPLCDEPPETYYSDVLQTDFLWTVPLAQSESKKQIMKLVLDRFLYLQKLQQQTPARP